MNPTSFRLNSGLLMLTCLLAPARLAVAAGPEASAPVLQELDRETRSIYESVEPGIVRVQLPVTRPAVGEVVTKWNKVLTPEMVAKLEQQQQEIQPGIARVLPDTQPDARQADYRPDVSPNEAPPVMPNAVGIVLDKDGHVFLPVWVDKNSLNGKTVPVVLGNGVESEARFIGSDHQTNVTILQVDGLSSPVRLSPIPPAPAPPRPADGSLVLVFSVRRTMTHLAVWTTGLPESGVVVNVDGSVVGFARPGEFLCASTCIPVVNQLIAFGRVNRAFLGVRVIRVGPDDPERLTNPALGQAASIRIAEVLPHSAADQAGLRENDLIQFLGGQSVDDPNTFGATIAGLSGKKELTILRGRQHLSVTVDLERPKN